MHPAGIRALLLATICHAAATAAPAATGPGKQEVIAVIRKVNDHWQKSHPVHGNAFWNHAVYHIGNLEAYQVTGEARYRAFSEAWAETNHWSGARSTHRNEWKSKYGETDKHVLFGDWQACFQVYISLDALRHDPVRTARAREVMAYQITTPQNDYLWWADGLFMVMPVMADMQRITGDDAFLRKLRAYYNHARNLMLDPGERLFFRDAKYIFPQHATRNGNKDFWSRGNGWVFNALPAVIDRLPPDHPDRNTYLADFRAMAARIAACQQPDGSWTRSMLDPDHAPGPESSGTAFFTSGFLWGLRHGALDRKTYEPAAFHAWHFLARTALQPDGSIGYVQPIGERAIPGQLVDASSTADFGTGAFLLAAARMARYTQLP